MVCQLHTVEKMTEGNLGQYLKNHHTSVPHCRKNGQYVKDHYVGDLHTSDPHCKKMTERIYFGTIRNILTSVSPTLWKKC